MGMDMEELLAAHLLHGMAAGQDVLATGLQVLLPPGQTLSSAQAHGHGQGVPRFAAGAAPSHAHAEGGGGGAPRHNILPPSAAGALGATASLLSSPLMLGLGHAAAAQAQAAALMGQPAGFAATGTTAAASPSGAIFYGSAGGLLGGAGMAPPPAARHHPHAARSALDFSFYGVSPAAARPGSARGP